MERQQVPQVGESKVCKTVHKNILDILKDKLSHQHTICLRNDAILLSKFMNRRLFGKDIGMEKNLGERDVGWSLFNRDDTRNLPGLRLVSLWQS